MRYRPHFLILLFCLASISTVAQAPLQSPSEFLGYELGSRFTPHHHVFDYFQQVAESSPMVTFEQYGTSYEGRPLFVVYVSSPENIEGLERIRLNNLRRAGLEEGSTSGPEAAVIWLSYNVHGNEAASTEAALKTLYELVRPEATRARSWLEETVIIIDPCLNPDGRERYVQWYHQVAGALPNPDPNAREHLEPWPGGRSNHYYFDLNRDWAWQTQRESIARIALYNRWMPQVHVDFHEQGVDAPYFFAPAAEPLHNSITTWQREFQTIAGKNHARYFDANHWLYFTRQVFDLFYPGYGDTWPTFQGAVGMTYEQGGSGRAGLAVITAEGDTLTLRDRLEHHFTTGMSTIEMAAAHQKRLLDEFEKYFHTAKTAPSGTYKTYVIKGTSNPEHLKALTAFLSRQHISYNLASSTHNTTGYHFGEGKTGDVKIHPGDLLVSSYQPKSVLVNVLFEPESELADSITYDQTAWAIPYAYGLEAYALQERIKGDTVAQNIVAPALTGSSEPYAYLAPWRGISDAAFLSDLLRSKIKVRFAHKPFSLDGRSYGRGTLIITRAGNQSHARAFDRIIRDAAHEHNISLFPAQTGFVSEGPDFGSGDVLFIKPPRVALLSGSPVSSYGLGELWHFFEQQIHYPVTLIQAEHLFQSRLSDYDVIILPNGVYGRILKDSELQLLKNWIRAGGRLIALQGALSLLAGDKEFGLQKSDPKSGAPTDSSVIVQTRYSERSRAAVEDDVRGSIYRIRLDSTHPLAFGYPDTYFSLVFSTDTYKPLGSGSWNVGILQEDGLLSGFVGHKARARLKDVLTFGVHPMGRGSITYFAENPLFRGLWHNGMLLVANATFFVGQ